MTNEEKYREFLKDNIKKNDLLKEIKKGNRGITIKAMDMSIYYHNGFYRFMDADGIAPAIVTQSEAGRLLLRYLIKEAKL